MKSTSKRIINIIIAFITFIVCLLIMYWGNEEPNNVTVILSMVVFFYFGYISRRPHPNERTLSDWYNIIVLKLKIGILKKNLKPFTDLRRYKHKSELHIREMVIEWRVELKKLERKLNLLK
jgi:hypothetical protein